MSQVQSILLGVNACLVETEDASKTILFYISKCVTTRRLSLLSKRA